MVFSASLSYRSLWTPERISTALWLDAADSSTITTVSGAVSQWDDKSGNGRNATQGTASARPTYSATGFNGLPTIQFDGSNDQLNLVQFAQVGGQNIFAVIDTVNLQTDYRIFLERTSGAGINLAIYLGGLSLDRRPLIYWNGGAGRAIWGSAVQSKAIVRWAFYSGSPASALTQVNAATPVTESFTASALTNWASINNGTVQQGNYNLSELIITPSNLSTANQERLEGYFAHKWGLTANLPSNHPFKNSPPRGI